MPRAPPRRRKKETPVHMVRSPGPVKVFVEPTEVEIVRVKDGVRIKDRETRRPINRTDSAQRAFNSILPPKEINDRVRRSAEALQYRLKKEVETGKTVTRPSERSWATRFFRRFGLLNELGGETSGYMPRKMRISAEQREIKEHQLEHLNTVLNFWENKNQEIKVYKAFKDDFNNLMKAQKETEAKQLALNYFNKFEKLTYGLRRKIYKLRAELAALHFAKGPDEPAIAFKGKALQKVLAKRKALLEKLILVQKNYESAVQRGF